MKNTTMKIKCWKLENGNEVPMPSTATLDGFQWNGKFRITVSNDDGSLGLPFLFATDDTAILTVETSEQKGTHTGNKKIKQILRCLPRSLEYEITCCRIRSHNGKEHVWSAWETMSSAGGIKVDWDASSCVDTFITAGIYNISGERLNVKDGLPIANSNPGHTIKARLVVLDSSISGTGDTDDKCITQILTLSNRTGGDGDVYIRTGRASIKNQLAGGSGWEPWGKLQQNIEVGQVASLDTFTGNGIYSGVYTNGSSFFETFVMVVINNYAVAGATGQVRSVSQFKYALNVDSTFSHKTRTGHGSTGISWGEWVDLGAATTTDIQDNSITAQKLSTALQEQINKSANGAYWTSGPNAVTLNINKNDGTVGWQTLPVATTEKAGVMSAEDKMKLDEIDNCLAVKKFYTLPAPREADDSYKKIEKVSLNILGQQEDFFRFEEKNSGNVERIFYAKDYGVQANVPLHFVSYIYSEKEQETYYQLYEKNVGYLQNFIVHLKIGWNKLELEHTFETVTQNQLFLYLGKEANNDFYLYKTFIYNGIQKAIEIQETTTYELNNRLDKIEPTLKEIEILAFGISLYDNEDVVFKGNGKTYNTVMRSIPVVAGDVYVVKLDGITKPADSPDNAYFRIQFYDGNNSEVASQKFFYSSDTPVNTEIVIPDGCVKLTYIFGLSVSQPSVLDGEYKWSGLTFKQLSRNDARFRDVETRVTELETLSNDWNGKILTTYGDSVTALQGGDFSYPYNLTNTQRWGNRVADYFKMSKHYGRGIGGQKYAWGTNGGSITWIEKATGKMIDRSDAYTLESWDGETFTSNVSDADRTRIIKGLADGSVISIRGCACSWLRITSMYPESIKNDVDVVFVMFHNDSVDGNEFSWVEGDTTDPEWAASSYYATYGGDYNINTLEGGIASTIMKLQTWLPNAVIILGTPINGQGTAGQLRPDANGLYKQVQHVKNVGLRFSIPVIDVYATCGINGLNRIEYITDNIHPYSVAGSKMVARAIIGGFKTILPKV